MERAYDGSGRLRALIVSLQGMVNGSICMGKDTALNLLAGGCQASVLYTIYTLGVLGMEFFRSFRT